jgi:hypothetical protein
VIDLEVTMSDALGSVMGLRNSSLTVLNTYEYDVFGDGRSNNGSTANAFTLPPLAAVFLKPE